MPLAIDISPADSRTITSPVLAIEVQLGTLTVTGIDGYKAQGTAGETIDGDKLRPPMVLTAQESPTRVRIFYDSEHAAYQAERRQEGSQAASRDRAQATSVPRVRGRSRRRFPLRRG